MHSSSKLFALVSCLAFALGGCAANPSVGGASTHAGTSSMIFSASTPTHESLSDYRPASMPQSLDGRSLASNGGPQRGAHLEGVGGR